MRNLAMEDTKREVLEQLQNDLPTMNSHSSPPFQDLITEKVSDTVLNAIVGDVTYRLKEIIQQCSQWIAQKNSSLLTVGDVNQVLERMNYPMIFGEDHQAMPEFWNIGGILVENDQEIDLCSSVLNNTNTFTLNGGLYIKNELIIGRGEDGSLGQLSEPLARCFDSIRAILCGSNEQHFRSLSLSLRSNSLLGPILPYVVDDIGELIKVANGRDSKLHCLLEVTDALVSNEYVDLSKSVSINKLLASLLSVAFSPNQGRDDDLRRKSADLLGRALLRWPNILLVREVLVKLNKCLQDSLLPLQVQRGSLQVLATMGNASLALVLWPLLLNRPTYGLFLEAIRSKPQLVADYAAIQDTLLVCSLALQGKNIGVDIPIKNALSVAAPGYPDAVYRLFSELMGEDVMCCRWPPPQSPKRFVGAISTAPNVVNLVARPSHIRPAPPTRRQRPAKLPRQNGKSHLGKVCFLVASQAKLRRHKFEQQHSSFSGHTSFQKLSNSNVKLGRKRIGAVKIVLNLQNAI
ncbi:uncharacterized protein LOC135942495 [Cloeon dipterum]|uniref:uncharacterized protein LOC135942495 n=1 Tax=Cloeon dipterum TaxID=197152 RepID=UPI00321FE032